MPRVLVTGANGFVGRDELAFAVGDGELHPLSR